jgi:hypothetical protein
VHALQEKKIQKKEKKSEDTLLIVQFSNVYADHCSDYNIFLI